jgi:hypothetical protein
MENHQDARFDKLEALIEKGLADAQITSLSATI